MPRKTKWLLDDLEAADFDDSHFRRLHHFGENASIATMRAYCDTVSEFEEGGENERVKRRLEYVRDGLRRGDGQLDDLCDKALERFPL